MALMLGALTIQGIAPGPQVMTQRPDLFWGLIASMWIGNADARRAQPAARSACGCSCCRCLTGCSSRAIMAFMAIGVYSLNNSALDVYMTHCFGLIGYRLHEAQGRAGAAASSRSCWDR